MSVRHSSPHPKAGQATTVDAALPMDGAGPHEFHAEDWADRVFGQSWMFMEGNPAAMAYAVRSAVAGLPLDDEVVYGKTASGRGHLVHVSELAGGEGR